MQPALSISSTIHTGTGVLILPGIPVADGFECDRGPFRELREEGPDFARCVTDPNALDELSLLVEDSEEREVLARPGGLGQGGHRSRPYNLSGTCCTSCGLMWIWTTPVYWEVLSYNQLAAPVPRPGVWGEPWESTTQ